MYILKKKTHAAVIPLLYAKHADVLILTTPLTIHVYMSFK